MRRRPRPPSRPPRPRRLAFTTAAQAPVPQAKVSPTPRSHTRNRIRSGAKIWATPILARSGKTALCSSSGPTKAIGTASISSTKNVACGLPIPTAAGPLSGPQARSRFNVSSLALSGMFSQPVRGMPISTVTRPYPARDTVSRSAPVRTRTVSPSVSSRSTAPMQRVALPQASTSPPSALRIRMKASASVSNASSMMIN